jgi:poly(A) polymerase
LVKIPQKKDFIKLEPEGNLKEAARTMLQDRVLEGLSALAKKQNLSLYLVGGYIRDLLLGMPGKDYDFTLPREEALSIPLIEEMLHLRFFKVGKEEIETTTYRVIKGDLSIDLTFRIGKTLEDDLERRDFTINTIAFSLRNDTFHWAGTALRDLNERVLRPASNHSIDQDPLRMLRAVRYLCTLPGFRLDDDLMDEISLKRQMITKVSGERIKTELDHILLSPRPDLGIRVLHESGLLLTLFPELKGLGGLGQGAHHHLTALSHTLLMVEKVNWAIQWLVSKKREVSFTREDLLSLYYATLFHDIGKADTYSKDEKERVHFYHHEGFSCLAAEQIMKRFRFSNDMRHRVLRIIEHHMRIHNLSRETRETALKKFANQIGDEIPLLVVHTLADKEASRGILSLQKDEVEEEHCLKLLDLHEQAGIVHPIPLITGEDVLALGYPAGPEVGRILNLIKEKQIEGEIETRKEALDLLKKEFGSECKQ